jgi:Caspase domain/Caspase recruitment domain
MNDNHRKLIEYNIEKLINETDYETMIKSLIEKKVLTDVMRNIIEQDGTNDLHKNRLLWNKLPHRGPAAFEKILETVRENGYNDMVKLLSASTISASTFNNDEAVIDKDNKTLSIATTRNMNRSNSYAPSSPINNNGNYIRDSPDAATTMTTNDGPCFSKHKKTKLEPYTEKTCFQFDGNLEVKRAANFGSHPKLGVYNMKSKKRGVFFFVNIIEFKSEKNNRRGAEMDRENLITLFSEMNYTVLYYEDLSRQEFHELLNQLIKSDYLKHVDSFICCIQTHGTLYNNQTIMEFTDGFTMGIDEVIDLFSNTNCKELVNKPKVFFFPFCRGGISDLEKKIMPVKIETDGAPSIYVPSFSDILICYGTVPGFMTHRDVGFGSWYVREMCKIFAEHAYDCHLEELLKLVGTKTMEIRDAGRVQVASTENRGFNKLLFFNPKISE